MTKLDEVKLQNAGLTVSRMVESYKRALSQEEHINILADQTLIEPDHIVAILKEAGVEVKKWHKRWEPLKHDASMEALELIHGANKKEEKKMEEKIEKEPKKRSKKKAEDSAPETAITANEVKVESITVDAAKIKAGQVTYGTLSDWSLPKITVPRWLYDLAETEYQLTKSRVEPFIEPVARLQEIERWLATHEAV